MNYYIERYREHRNNDFRPNEAFAIVASGIAFGGTIKDLQEVERYYWMDKMDDWNEAIERHNTQMNEWEEMNNERTTAAISIAK